LFDDQWIFLPGLSGSWKPYREWQLRGSVQRSYRMPSLNELYYNPGGNPDLKPENGWSLEGGYSFTRVWNSSLRLQHSLDAYTRWVNDWIIWLGGAIWTPHNLAAVHSRGLQTDNELFWQMGAVSLKSGLSIAYTRATPTESYLPNDQSIGKQIPYTPEWTGSASIGMNWKGWSVNYAHRFNGIRYITVDESDWLDPYSIGTVILSYSFGGKDQNLADTECYSKYME
jgi:iron complex outermembrane receptor protein